MQRTIALISATVALAGGSLRAQDIAGVWQGTITDQGTPLRQVLRLARADTGWRALFVSLDLASDTLAIRGVALKGRDVVITFGDDALGIADARTTYQGTLSRDGRSITGSLIDSDGRYPLNFKRVSGRDIWPLPAPHTIRFVAADTNVKLEVLDWGGIGPSARVPGRPWQHRPRVRSVRHEIHVHAPCLRHHSARIRRIQQTGTDTRQLRCGPSWRRRARGDRLPGAQASRAGRPLDSWRGTELHRLPVSR
jgi:hypothetical protein